VIERLRRAGVPADQLAGIRTEPLPDLWIENEPAMSILQVMPWLQGANGTSGLDWSQLDRLKREFRFGRPYRKELPALLRLAEGWVMAEMAERRRRETT